jgi:ribonuclease P protein component
MSIYQKQPSRNTKKDLGMKKTIHESLTATNGLFVKDKQCPKIALSSLKKRKDFLGLKQSKLRTHLPFCILQMAPTEYQGITKIHLGIIVTKKLGHAPFRNRIRRRLKSAFRKALQELEGITQVSSHCVLVARKESFSYSFPLMTQEIRKKIALFLDKMMVE